MVSRVRTVVCTKCAMRGIWYILSVKQYIKTREKESSKTGNIKNIYLKVKTKKRDRRRPDGQSYRRVPSSIDRRANHYLGKKNIPCTSTPRSPYTPCNLPPQKRLFHIVHIYNIHNSIPKTSSGPIKNELSYEHLKLWAVCLPS